MRFRLLYEGPLRGNRRRSEEKDRIRLVFSRQLQQLWTDYLPLSSLRREAEHYSAREVGGRFFLPMAIKSLTFRCEVDILILSPSRDLGIIRNADIDNRVKTLIDALRLPTQRSEVSQVICENTVDHPVYVLLEDDSLITSISAKSDSLLGASSQEIDGCYARTIIAVHIFPLVPGWGTISLIG